MNTTVQIISIDPENFANWPVTANAFDKFSTVDQFDVTIVDASSARIWQSKKNCVTTINIINDFKSLKQSVLNSQAAKVVYVLPKNLTFSFYYDAARAKYVNKVSLKNIWTELTDNVFPELLPTNICDCLLFENCFSKVNGEEFQASFAILPEYCQNTSTSILTEAVGSKKPTTIAIDRFYYTTLQILESEQKLRKYLQGIGLWKEVGNNYPAWLLEYEFLDDKEQKERILKGNKIIQDAKQEIELAEKKCQENLQYKAALVENGEQLVDIVFRILEKMLKVDLSHFVDEKKEDFLIRDLDITFIGEIKGVGSNVKSSAVSQVDVHFHTYREKLEEEGRQETVKQLLIINPLRDKPPDQREPVHENQIKLARDNGCLIITTQTLLNIFEGFCKHTISTADIKKVFSTEVGLLSMEAFGIMKGS